ncbi:MAG TPA: hypothetical protein VJ810_23640 [Blastocatellia bacterium]|nr:hypothetical protein [Blastocatellia bacterium]
MASQHWPTASAWVDVVGLGSARTFAKPFALLRCGFIVSIRLSARAIMTRLKSISPVKLRVGVFDEREEGFKCVKKVRRLFAENAIHHLVELFARGDIFRLELGIDASAQKGGVFTTQLCEGCRSDLL